MNSESPVPAANGRKLPSMGILFWCLLRFLTFAGVGIYICAVFSFFTLVNPHRFYYWLPPAIGGLLMILFGIGLWGRWRYLWVFVSVMGALVVFPWVDNFFWSFDFDDHSLLLWGSVVVAAATTAGVRFSYRRWPIKSSRRPYSFFASPSITTKVASVLIGTGAMVYCLTYINFSLHGRYEPDEADIRGVKYYGWAPKGFVDKYVGIGMRGTYYFGLLKLDQLFWHNYDLYESGRYPVDEVGPDDLGKLYREWDCSVTSYKVSPNNQYRAWVRAIGDRKSPFVYQTQKTIRIGIVRNLPNYDNSYDAWDAPEGLLRFTSDYHFECSDVFFNTSWDNESNVTVVVYDYAPGVFSEDAHKSGSPSNYIATLSFMLDKHTGEFREKKP